MYIERLTIENFRCFAKTEFRLNHPEVVSSISGSTATVRLRLPNVNLFVGGNGSGKSSVFKSIVIGVLSPIVGSAQIPPAFLVRRSSRPGDASDYFGLARESWINARLSLNAVDTTTTDRSIAVAVQIEARGDIEEIQPPIDSKSNRSAVWTNLFSSTSPAFFLTGYGASRRTERPEGYSEQNRIPRYQRVASLFEEHVGLVPFSYASLQLGKSRRFEESRAVLNSLLPAEVQLLPDEGGESIPAFDVKGIRLPFVALSDGYRAFVGWVWDLLLQLARVAPKGTALTDLPGVVIVDEIDLFLHPEWQRRVVEQVATTFPKLQFLFSTHSPLVAGSLEARNIFVLDTDEDGGAVVRQYDENIYGLTASQVLTSSYFGLHSTRAPNTGTLEDLAEDMLRKAMGGDEDAAREYLKQRQAAVTPE